MKLRNLFKKTNKILFTFLMTLGMVAVANAAPNNITVYKENYSGSTQWTNGFSWTGASETFHIKKLSDGTYVYCADYAHVTPNGVQYTLSKKIDDPGYIYIINQGPTVQSGSNIKEYFIVQNAYWIYDYKIRGLDPKTNGSVDALNKMVNYYASSNEVAGKIKQLVDGAYNARNNGTASSTVSLSVSTNNLTFTLSNDGKYYVSNTVKVTTDGNYNVAVNGPTGTVKEDVTGGFIVKVPVSSVTGMSANVSATVTSNKTVNGVYQYEAGGKYQPIVMLVPETVSDKKELSGTISKTSVTISKADATTGEEVEGAHLKLVCNNGAYVKEWTSGKTPKVLADVPEGKCTLSETLAPAGYIQTTETITFEVVAGKATAKQTMYNKPDKHDVEISKVDIATSAELIGAKLEVRNEKGDLVCDWISDGKVHTCKNLPSGTYTLTEITAPDGYDVAESIKFTLDKDGKLSQDGKTVDKIVMKDALTPTVVTNVPDTLSLRTSLPYILGLVIILAGTGLVYKSLKKNEQ